MQKFRRAESLLRFVSIHSLVHNHFNVERHLVSRNEYRLRRYQAMGGWQVSCALMVGQFYFASSLRLAVTIPQEGTVV